MEVSGDNSDSLRPSSSTSISRRFRLQFSPSNFTRFPISALLDYSGLLRPTPTPSSIHEFPDSDSLPSSSNENYLLHDPPPPTIPNPFPNANAPGDEFSICIIGAAEQDGSSNSIATGVVQSGDVACPAQPSLQIVASSAAFDVQDGFRGERGATNGVSQSNDDGNSSDTEAVDGTGVNNSNRDTTYQRYDIQRAVRWIEQILPFCLLLLVVFIRQHLQGRRFQFSLASVSFLYSMLLGSTCGVGMMTFSIR